jgi:hypothetical protein
MPERQELEMQINSNKLQQTVKEMPKNSKYPREPLGGEAELMGNNPSCVTQTSHLLRSNRKKNKNRKKG